ncbi:MAG: PD-(D/E)XK nuclease family protein [Dehalococcoidales bacterium]|nr:MAG: PD-(D/E)XK nuclease family protein [Dehalococcoidales bacterium]
MPLYSHSQLSTYQECPLKYRFRYRDKIRRFTEGVESFLGTMVHETLKKCYDNVRFGRVSTLDNLLAQYDRLWRKEWHDSIIITREELTADDYQALGKRFIETYYQRYAPFDSDLTIGTEMRLNFALDDGGKYKLTGIIDRLSRTKDGVYQVHDYKTSAHLPGQEDVDNDRQLGLYHLGVKKKWPDIENISLIWHYLAFDRELISSRSGEEVARLANDSISLIDEISSAVHFPPIESALCQWCEYPDLCPMRKHLYQVAALPENEYLIEPGVTLVNKYAELREKASAIDKEIEKVRDALIDYAQRQQIQIITGSQNKARVVSGQRLRFPAKNKAEREELDKILKETGKWSEVSQLDTTTLTRIITDKLWDKELIDRVMQYGQLEETSSIYLSRLKDEERGELENDVSQE